jgi:hypothetical protein
MGVKNAQLKIEQYDKSKEALDILVNLSEGKINTKIWDEVLRFDDINFNSKHKNLLVKLIFQIKKIQHSKQIFYHIKERISRDSPLLINLYYQNLGDPLTNKLYYYNWQKPFQAHLIEDGVANYYNYYDNVKNAEKVMVRKYYFYKLLNYDFTKPESLTGIENEKTVSQYVREPSLALGGIKNFVLKDLQTPFEPISKRILVLGQEGYVNLYGLKKYHDAVHNLLNTIIIKYPNSEVFYKPHWNSDVKVVQDSRQIQLVETKESAEEITLILKPEIVISFSSSALLYVAWACKDLRNSKRLEIFYRKAFTIAPEIENLYKISGISKI